ncbi:unnamed protein product [Cuscuta campestris]|uniref:Uncharacterized protein n=1 Tax=Cuscuta campestris TaxID=132261 RepID=A0A484KHR9_9ASTE|nr:unnamed protein product [Cuscuta campestris]
MAPLSTDPMDRLPTGLKLFVRNLTPAKLDDTNYPSWSAMVRANLMAHRLLGYVDGTEPKPPSMILDEKAAAPAKDEPPILKPNPAHETWLVVDAQLRACLLAIVSPVVQTHIHALPTAADIWNHLEQRYNSLSRTHIFQLKEQLHGLQKGPPQAYHVNQSVEPSQNWHLDTGANAHVTSDLSRLQYSTPYHGTNSITAAGGVASGCSLSAWLASGSSVSVGMEAEILGSMACGDRLGKRGDMHIFYTLFRHILKEF